VLPVMGETKKDEKKSLYRRGVIAAENSPPYVFSPSFFKNTDWVPENSALPPQWEFAVPQKLQ